MILKTGVAFFGLLASSAVKALEVSLAVSLFAANDRVDTYTSVVCLVFLFVYRRLMLLPIKSSMF